jgi:hypothetical protein
MNQQAASPRSGIKKRVVGMAFAWLILGAAVGANAGLRLQAGAIAVAAQVTAGIIVFSLLGVLLGLFVARAEESMLGGLCGMLVGLASGSRENPAAQAEIANLCLVMGALVGATGWPWIRIIVGSASGIKRVLGV